MGDDVSSKPSEDSPGFLADVQASAAKAWEDKVSGVSKSVEEQVKAASGAAEDALEAGISRVSAAVRAGVAAVSAEGAAAKARVAQFYGTGLAHYQATEAQAVELVKQGVRYVSVDHPQASLAASAAAAAILLPGPRRFLFRQTIGRFRSEEAVFRSAELRYGALRERVEGQSSDLHRLQEALQGAEAEYLRGLSHLKSAAGELQSLGSRAHSSSKAAATLVRDLRELPSKAALQLRSDAANTAAAAEGQAGAVAKAMKRLAKQYGI